MFVFPVIERSVHQTSVPLSEIPYVVSNINPRRYHFSLCVRQDYPTIVFNAKESVEMPFRTCQSSQKFCVDNPRSGYISANGEPRLPPGMREHLYDDLNKSFDF